MSSSPHPDKCSECGEEFEDEFLKICHKCPSQLCGDIPPRSSSQNSCYEGFLGFDDDKCATQGRVPPFSALHVTESSFDGISCKTYVGMASDMSTVPPQFRYYCQEESRPETNECASTKQEYQKRRSGQSTGSPTNTTSLSNPTAKKSKVSKKADDDLCKCYICEAGFIQKNHLKAHMKKNHSAGRCYLCNFCHVKFADTVDRAHHQLVHLSLNERRRKLEIKDRNAKLRQQRNLKFEERKAKQVSFEENQKASTIKLPAELSELKECPEWVQAFYRLPFDYN